jgi:hypothetical protein
MLFSINHGVFMANIVGMATYYVQTQSAFKAAGGEEFLVGRFELRDDFTGLAGVSTLTGDQIVAITRNLPEGPVQTEAVNRLTEWNNKIIDGKLVKKTDSEISVQNFAEKVNDFYVKYSELLSGSAYSEFNEAKQTVRAFFCDVYKVRSVEEVAEELLLGGINKNFIEHASNEWGNWKASNFFS